MKIIVIAFVSVIVGSVISLIAKKDKICCHCKYQKFFCYWFRCDPYKEAKMKQKERWYNKYFPIEDYAGEERYLAGEAIGFGVMLFILTMMIICVIKVIGEWL